MSIFIQSFQKSLKSVLSEQNVNKNWNLHLVKTTISQSVVLMNFLIGNWLRFGFFSNCGQCDSGQSYKKHQNISFSREASLMMVISGYSAHWNNILRPGSPTGPICFTQECFFLRSPFLKPVRYLHHICFQIPNNTNFSTLQCFPHNNVYLCLSNFILPISPKWLLVVFNRNKKVI